MQMEGVREEVAPHNPWWTTGEKQPVQNKLRRSDYKHHQNLFVESRKRLLLLSGRRGIGKTNTIHRLINDLLGQEDVSPNEILYFPLDNPAYQSDHTGHLITEIKDWYKERILRERDEDYFVFLDDVHSIGDENWRRQVRDLLEDENAHVVVSTVHGDFDNIEQELGHEVPPPHMLPRKFFDYLTPQMSGSDTDQLKRHSRRVRRSILQSIDDGPELLKESLKALLSQVDDVDLTNHLKEYERRNLSQETPEDRSIADQLELTIYKEIPRVRGFRNVAGVHRLCKHIAETSSEYVSYRGLESELEIESRQLKRYVEALDDFYLVNPVYPFNYDVRRNFRLYLQNPSYSYVFAGTPERVSPSKVQETVVLDHLKRLSFYFHSTESSYTITSGGKVGDGTDAYNFKEDIDFVFNYYPDLATNTSEERPSPPTHEISIPTGSGGTSMKAASVPVNVSNRTRFESELEEMQTAIRKVNDHDSGPDFGVGLLLTEEDGNVELHENVLEVPRALFALAC
jgi:predicted AAA+ superfamily ATPase